MNPDEIKAAWQRQSSRTRITIDPELLLKEVRRNEMNFNAIIFWRDVREVSVSLLVAPVWLVLGFTFQLPWTWFLAVPAGLWIAGFMLVDRWRQQRQQPRPGEPLRQCVQSSLAEMEHQIWLLRNVGWWYLLPLGASVLAFCAQGAWQERSGGWLTALVLSIVVALVFGVFAAVYWVNQYAVRAGLEPRRRELEALLSSLNDEGPGASA